MSNAITINKLSKSFSKKTVINNISMSLAAGQIYGFLGPNGAGKTTTIRLLLGFITPSSGQIEIFGKYRPGAVEVLRQIGFVSADAVFYPRWDARVHIDFVNRLRGGKTYALELADLLQLDLTTKYQKLSSGNKQKLGLVLALMYRPKLLILDEPTRGLDPLLQQQLHNILRDFAKSGGTIFMSSHDLGEVQNLCDQVGIIRAGQLIADQSMSDLRSLNAYEARVVFAKTPKPGQFTSKSVQLVAQHANQLTLHVNGQLEKFLAELSKEKIVDISIAHLSLEDAFMRYYK